MRENNNKRRTVLVLSIVVIILALVLIYFVGVKPAMLKHDQKVYTQGVNYTISYMIASLQNAGYVQIPLNQNRSITLVPYNPPAASGNSSVSAPATNTTA